MIRLKHVLHTLALIHEYMQGKTMAVLKWNTARILLVKTHYVLYCTVLCLLCKPYHFNAHHLICKCKITFYICQNMHIEPERILNI